MKKAVLAVIVLSFLAFYSGAQAEDKKHKAVAQNQTGSEQQTEPAAGVKPVKNEEASEQAKIKEEQLKKAKEELGKEERSIYLSSLTDKKAKIKKDVITFSEGKVASKDLSEKGYPQTNYTLSIQDDGTIVWETMQSSEKGDVAFWKGELKDGVMRGILSLHLKNELNSQDFSFNTTAPAVTHEEKTETKEKEQPHKKVK